MLEKLKNQKKLWLPIVGGVIGVLLILFGGNLGGEKTRGSTDGEAYYNVSFYTETLERRIESLCTSISGISKAEVLEDLGDEAFEVNLLVGGVIIAVKGCESMEDVQAKIDDGKTVKGIIVTIVLGKATSAVYKEITEDDLK